MEKGTTQAEFGIPSYTSILPRAIATVEKVFSRKVLNSFMIFTNVLVKSQIMFHL